MKLRRPRWKPVRERNPVVVAIVGLLLIATIGSVAYKAQDLPVIGGGTYYSAYFTEAAGLRPGNEVRVAGVKVGTVQEVALDHARVKVTFRVRNTWVGDASTVAIEIKTVLGDKYLALDPLGSGKQAPRQTIPTSRTTSPYDVMQAFQDLSSTVGEIDTDKLARSLQTISDTWGAASPQFKPALTGLADFSKVIASRDAQLAKLLAGTKTLSGQLSAQASNISALLQDGNQLLAEVRLRRDAIHNLLLGTQALSAQLSGLVDDNSTQLQPTLQALNKVTALLQKNHDDLNRALSLAGPYSRLLGNTLGNGRWMDAYLCGLVPKNYLPAGTGPATGCMPPAPKGGK